MLDIVESIRHRFASFDTLVQLTPLSFINLCRWLLFSVIIYAFHAYETGFTDVNLFSGGSYLAKFLTGLFTIKLTQAPGIKAALLGALIVIWFRILYRIGAYFSNMLMAIYIFLIEDARIKKMSFWKKVLFTFTWPTFDSIGRYTTYAALFMNVTWKPIPHESKVTIDDINGGENK